MRPSSSSAQRKDAATRVADQIATQASNAAAKAVQRELKKPAVQQRIAAAAKQVGPIAKNVAGAAILGAAVGYAYKQGKPVEKSIAALRRVEKNLKRKLTPDEWKTLYKQHLAFYRANPQAP